MSEPTTIAEIVAQAGKTMAEQAAARVAKPVEVAAENPVTAEVAAAVEAPTEAPAEVQTDALVAEVAGESKATTLKAVRVDDQGVIFGIGAMAGNVDGDGEIVTTAALLGMAYDFCSSKARVFRANHDKNSQIDVDFVESKVGAPILKSGRTLKAGEELPAEDPVIGINIEKGNEIAWFISVRPKDAAITEAARKGELVGFSWGGYATKE